MRFSFSDEQQQFRDIVNRFLNAKYSTVDARRLLETDRGFDDALWRDLTHDLGLPALVVPEEYGGQGFGWVEMGIVMEEMGRVLLCSPYYSSAVLACSAILNAGSEDDKQRLLPDLANGSARGCLAVFEPGGSWTPDGIAMVARDSADGYLLSGTKSFVIDGHTADTIIVVARLEGTVGDVGITLFEVVGVAAGLTRKLLKTIDGTRKHARLTLVDVPGRPIGVPGEGAVALNVTLDQASVALANEMVGGAEHMLYSAVEYAGARRQFGRLIGSFQAIKHKCADLLLEVELAKSAAYGAASALAENHPQAGVLASMAKCSAADAFMRAAADCIQIHGGIGFTWDHDTHLWFKRAKCSEVLFGDPNWHRERVALNWSDDL